MYEITQRFHHHTEKIMEMSRERLKARLIAHEAMDVNHKQGPLCGIVNRHE